MAEMCYIEMIAHCLPAGLDSPVYLSDILCYHQTCEAGKSLTNNAAAEALAPGNHPGSEFSVPTVPAPGKMAQLRRLRLWFCSNYLNSWKNAFLWRRFQTWGSMSAPAPIKISRRLRLRAIFFRLRWLRLPIPDYHR